MDLSAQTADTLAAIKKAQTSGVTSALGLTGIDLSGVISQIPVPATFYNKLAKTKPDVAGPNAIWRVLTNINNLQANPATAFDYSAPLHQNQMITVSSPYKKLGYGYTVTKDAIALAKGFADAKSIEVMGTLNQYKIGADVLSLSGQNFALATPATPTVTPQTNPAGNIPTATAVPVKVAARTGTNYRYGGSTIASAAGTATTAAANSSALVTVPAVRGAVAYDWFVNGYYYTTTIVNTVTVTSIPTSNQAVPNLLGLSATAPTSVPTSDSSANPNEFNGILATLAGDYNAAGGYGLVSAGGGTPSGATFQSLDGKGFTGSGQNINELDNLNAAIYNATFLSPSAYMCSSVDAAAISKLLMATAGGGTTFFTPGPDGRTDVTAGGFVGHYVNKSTGTPVRIEVHPNMVPGTLIARTDQVNFPSSGISNVFELRELDPIQDFEYGVSRNAGVAGGGPRFDGEVYSSSTLINHVPAAQAVLSNIQS